LVSPVAPHCKARPVGFTEWCFDVFQFFLAFFVPFQLKQLHFCFKFGTILFSWWYFGFLVQH
jgi:hypothetical protein